MAKTELNVNVNPPSLLFVVMTLVALALFFLGYAIWSGSAQQSQLITISASGTLTADPTQSSIYIFLNGTGPDSASAVSNLSTVTGRVNATLRQYINGNTSLIETLSYNVYPSSNCTEYYYPQTYPPYYTTTICSDPRTFYTASEYLRVTIPNVGSTNAALVGLSGIKGVSINNVEASLSLAQQANLSQKALTLALSNATSQAQALSGGRQISVKNITVQNNYIYYAGGSVFSAEKPAYNQTFFPGRATVTKNIYVVFSMH